MPMSVSERKAQTPVCWIITPTSGTPYFVPHSLLEQHLRNAAVIDVTRQSVINLYQVSNAAPLFLGNVALLEKI